jgi:hypothetical protein
VAQLKRFALSIRNQLKSFNGVCGNIQKFFDKIGDYDYGRIVLTGNIWLLGLKEKSASRSWDLNSSVL